MRTVIEVSADESTGPGPFVEDEAPTEGPVTATEQPVDHLRRMTVRGIGVLLLSAIALGAIVVVIRPELADFAKSFLQIAVGGLIGLGGTVVGFLFARSG